jgi:hypothetical protein
MSHRAPASKHEESFKTTDPRSICPETDLRDTSPPKRSPKIFARYALVAPSAGLSPRAAYKAAMAFSLKSGHTHPPAFTIAQITVSLFFTFLVLHKTTPRAAPG